MYNKAFKRSHDVYDRTVERKNSRSRNPVVLARLSELHREFESDLRQRDENNPDWGVFSQFNIEVFSSFADAKHVWEQFEEDAACFVYQRFAFCRTWYETVGRKDTTALHIVAVHDLTGATLMLLPLCIEKTRFATVLKFIGDGMADYLSPLVQDDFAKNIAPDQYNLLWQNILSTIEEKIDLVWLNRQTNSIVGVKNPVTMLDGFDFISSSHALNFPPAVNWTRCARTLRSGQTTKKIARRFSKLATVGKVEFVEITDRQQRQQHLDRLLTMKVANLNDAGILHRMDKPEIRQFYSGLVDDAVLQENLCQFELLCGGKTIASA
ncbi:MAG TPA: hypothetical protein ENJ55_01345, partial [Rhizobiales bacterium]|nr:hypothetical protein [Hyphomicrobiales bacterium]